MLRSAPPLLIPVPLNASASAPIVKAPAVPSNSKAAPDVTLTPPATVPSAVLLAARKAPALIVVRPVYRLAPESTKLPDPAFVRAPEVLVLAPDIVKVFAATSMVPVVVAVKVKLRFVEAVAPVYCRVPPLNTRFDAVTAAAPRCPAAPPSPIVPTDSVPDVSVVTPVNVFTPESVVVVAAPVFVRATAPLKIALADPVPFMV